MPTAEQLKWLRAVIGAAVDTAEGVADAVGVQTKDDAGQLWKNGTVLADAQLPAAPPKSGSPPPTKIVDKCPTHGQPLSFEDPTISGDAKKGFTVEVPGKKETGFKTRKEAEAAARKMEKEAEDEAGNTGKGGKCDHAGATWLVQGDYWISAPTGASGTLPLVVLFAGNNGKGFICKQTPKAYFTSALLAYSDSCGSFTAIQASLTEALKKTQIKVGSVTICGYSAGGRGAMKSYSAATKKVGLIDPTMHDDDRFDSKAILSVFLNPGAWDGLADSSKKGGNIAQAREAAVKKVADAGGYAETTCVNHYAYPQYFLSTFKGDLF